MSSSASPSTPNSGPPAAGDRDVRGLTGSTHFDQAGNVRMVDVSGKATTVRRAVASARLWLSAPAADIVRQGGGKKGDVLAVARIAGINASKQTSQLIPLCHAVPVEAVEIDFEWLEEQPLSQPESGRDVHSEPRRRIGPAGRTGLVVTAVVRTTAKTGVEMESLTAVTVASLTVYDMLKSVDREIEVGQIRLVSKSGGKSGNFTRDQDAASLRATKI